MACLLAALTLAYTGWIGYQLVRGKLYDFNLYYIAADGFRRGMDVYALAKDYATVNRPRWAELAARHGIEHYAPPYRYPPLTAQLVLPLTLLSPRTAGAIWLALTAATFMVSAWLMGRSVAPVLGPPLACLLLLGFVPPLTTLHAGQVNGLLLLSLSLAMLGLSQRRWAYASVGVALGTLIKLIPVALLLYLAWRGRWRATALALILMAALLLTAPLTLGAGTLRSYSQHFFVMGQPGTVFTTPPNQSLNGLYGRLLAGLAEERAIYSVYLASAALVVLGTVALCWPPGPGIGAWRLEFALIVCALLLITPYTWYHQLVLLLIPFLVLSVEVIQAEAPRWWLAPLALGFLVTDLHGLAWHHLSGRLLLSAPCGTTLMLWIMLAWLITRRRRAGTQVRLGTGTQVRLGTGTQVRLGTGADGSCRP